MTRRRLGEEEIAAVLPEARVLRMDLDTTARRGSHRQMLDEFGRGEADVLLGTQMVAKGLDFPRVTLVGIVNADTGMLLPELGRQTGGPGLVVSHHAEFDTHLHSDLL